MWISRRLVAYDGRILRSTRLNAPHSIATKGLSTWKMFLLIVMILRWRCFTDQHVLFDVHECPPLHHGKRKHWHRPKKHTVPLEEHEQMVNAHALQQSPRLRHPPPQCHNRLLAGNLYGFATGCCRLPSLHSTVFNGKSAIRGVERGTSHGSLPSDSVTAREDPTAREIFFAVA